MRNKSIPDLLEGTDPRRGTVAYRRLIGQRRNLNQQYKSMLSNQGHPFFSYKGRITSLHGWLLPNGKKEIRSRWFSSRAEAKKWVANMTRKLHGVPFLAFDGGIIEKPMARPRSKKWDAGYVGLAGEVRALKKLLQEAKRRWGKK